MSLRHSEMDRRRWMMARAVRPSMRGQDGHGKDPNQQHQEKATQRKLLEREREKSWNMGGWREEDGDVHMRCLLLLSMTRRPDAVLRLIRCTGCFFPAWGRHRSGVHMSEDLAPFGPFRSIFNSGATEVQILVG